MNHFTNICVYCGSSPGRSLIYQEAAIALGEELAQRGIGLVYGGGNVGLMGTLACAVANAGGQVTGIIPGSLLPKELVGETIGDQVLVGSMHERKAQMIALADGFIALPGGYGTLDELFETITWAQLGIHSKPIGLLNVAGYFDALIQWIDHAVAEQLIRPEHRQLLVTAASPAALLEMMTQQQPPAGLTKWVTRED